MRICCWPLTRDVKITEMLTARATARTESCVWRLFEIMCRTAMLTAKGLTIFGVFRSIIRTIISDAYALFILFISAGNLVTRCIGQNHFALAFHRRRVRWTEPWPKSLLPRSSSPRHYLKRLEKIFMDLCRIRFGVEERISWEVS